ncbi:hypothetical protein ACFO8Q_22255 [Effusibacillus consociatus]|uniref:Uncharacterized protein n=1 Tax=Effusibacillus consociatus TaxID=1117041 RepID=A0ABV9QBK0_9BACL
MAGGLDLPFIHSVFQKHHVDFDRLPEFTDAYFSFLKREANRGNFELLPGVTAILEQIDKFGKWRSYQVGAIWPESIFSCRRFLHNYC